MKEENQQGIGSFVFSTVNPLSQLRYQFLGGVWSFPTYYGLRRGKLKIEPMYMFDLFSAGHLSKLAESRLADTTLSPAKRYMWKYLGGYDFSSKQRISSMISSATKNGNITETALKEAAGELDDLLIRNKSNLTLNTKSISNILQKKTGLGLEQVTADALATRISSYTTGFRAITRIVPVVGYVLAAYDAGRIAAKAVSLIYKGAESFSNFTKAKAESARALEFAKPLYGGYISHTGVTERQRALSELARTPTINRRFIGNEAMYYSGYAG